MLTATALVLFMTPGLALFYGGMVRSKNILGMLMQNVFAMGLIGVLWAVVGFSLAFGDGGGLVGNFDFAFLKDVMKLDAEGGIVNELPGLDFLTIPPVLFFAFQMMFAIITPALITGATADRLKFRSYVLFIGLWSVLVYSPLAHWVFSPTGWLFERGALDFAGGTAIHINAGVAALVLVAMIGKRRGYPEQPMPPHNLPLTLIGTGILWFGWFGFNAGSAAAANAQAAQALVNTSLAASAAMLGWLVAEKLRSGHATTLGGASGAVAGLVAITPCAGYVGGMSPIVIGAIAGVACYLAIGIKRALKLDDSLDVIAVHLVGGVVGSLLLGFFGDASATGFGTDGVFFGGGGDLLTDQVVAVVAAIAFSAVASFVIAKFVDIVSGLRVDADAEDTGLDVSQHAETAYAA
ncbi:MAG TPA: ammonium transporter [Acidimicrobiales bacterium]|nr:ammonium transporter [Acidimicrobiales bacterium]